MTLQPRQDRPPHPHRPATRCRSPQTAARHWPAQAPGPGDVSERGAQRPHPHTALGVWVWVWNACCCRNAHREPTVDHRQTQLRPARAPASPDDSRGAESTRPCYKASKGPQNAARKWRRRAQEPVRSTGVRVCRSWCVGAVCGAGEKWGQSRRSERVVCAGLARSTVWPGTHLSAAELPGHGPTHCPGVRLTQGNSLSLRSRPLHFTFGP